MKKLKLSKMELAQMSISQKELSKLKGGYDVNNDNSIVGCVCYYNNTGVIRNTNSVNGCTCTCN